MELTCSNFTFTQTRKARVFCLSLVLTWTQLVYRENMEKWGNNVTENDECPQGPKGTKYLSVTRVSSTKGRLNFCL